MKDAAARHCDQQCKVVLAVKSASLVVMQRLTGRKSVNWMAAALLLALAGPEDGKNRDGLHPACSTKE